MVTADEMRAVDRVATEDVGIGLVQMMENAGRTLALHVWNSIDSESVCVVAGNGGNGGGGLVCARHLTNHGVSVAVRLDRDPGDLTGVAGAQWQILEEMGIPVRVGAPADRLGEVVVDALIGYGLRGEVRGTAAELVEWMAGVDCRITSLDVPSGIDATSGEVMGQAIRPDRTVTLALPKTGLVEVGSELVLADIGIPETVYERLGIDYDGPFSREFWVELMS